MIIKITPETEAEKQRMQTVEHYGVREFLIFGNKETEGEVIDFHDWNGAYRYLVGSLYYFTQTLLNEQQTKERRPSMNFPQQPMVKTVDGGKIEGVLTPEQLEQITKDVEKDHAAKQETPKEDENPVLQFPAPKKDKKEKKED